MKNKLTYMVIVLAGLSVLAGCQETRKGKFNIARRNITIITEPEGATVTQLHPFMQPSTNLGTTPFIDQPVVVITNITKMQNLPYAETQELMKAAGGNVKVRIQKDGYETYEGILGTKFGETLSHEITLEKKEPQPD